MNLEQDPWSIDPQKLPKTIELELSSGVVDHVAKIAAATGRSPEEILVELIDRGLSQANSSSSSLSG